MSEGVQMLLDVMHSKVLAFQEDQDLLLVVLLKPHHRTVELYRRREKIWTYVFRGLPNLGAFSSDGSFLSVARDGVISVLALGDLSKFQAVYEVERDDCVLQNLAVSHKGNVAYTKNGSVYVIGPQTGPVMVREIKNFSSRPRSLHFLSENVVQVIMPSAIERYRIQAD